MTTAGERFREHALSIWRAGVAAVDSARLVQSAVHVEGSRLVVCGHGIDLSIVDTIAVVGAGKAGAGMAEGLLAALGADVIAGKRVAGWINVPADCVRPMGPIHLHAGRPAGVNEPTADGVRGAEEILRRVSQLGPRDLCLCLISGGASALAPAPAAGISLEDKLAVTRHLSGAGANIAQLNTVRKQLSRIKGGGLARACGAGHLLSLIISDVMGDPLDVIASGPTVYDRSTPAEALSILESFDARQAGIAQRVFEYLRDKAKRGGVAGGDSPSANRAGERSKEKVEGFDSARSPAVYSQLSPYFPAGKNDAARSVGEETQNPACEIHNLVVGNNAVAVSAAAKEAVRLGYESVQQSAVELEGPAEEVGRELIRAGLSLGAARAPRCLVSGGEPVVRLVAADRRGKGGRNQQLALAALLELMSTERCEVHGVVLAAGGTDGEDGPTDAAGALVDAGVIDSAQRQGLDASDFLSRNDAYHFFERTGGLIRTGPTHTNVGDLRVMLIPPADAT